MFDDLLFPVTAMFTFRCDILRPHGAANIDPTITVNDMMACYPQSIGPLKALGIDTCCGGTDSLRVAANHAGVPLTVLLAAIDHAVITGRA
jgi:hypothetical protein